MALTPEEAIRRATSDGDAERVLELVAAKLITIDAAFEVAIELRAAPALTRALIDAGADVNRRVGNYNEPPLHVAARRGDVALYRVLRQAKASVSALDEAGYTLLHSAACGGHVMLLSDVLACGLDVNAVSEGGETALSLAMVQREDDSPEQAEAKARRVVELLLQAGARPDERAVREAAEVGFLSLVERLGGKAEANAEESPGEDAPRPKPAPKKRTAPRRRRKRSSRSRW